MSQSQPTGTPAVGEPKPAESPQPTLPKPELPKTVPEPKPAEQPPSEPNKASEVPTTQDKPTEPIKSEVENKAAVIVNQGSHEVKPSQDSDVANKVEIPSSVTDTKPQEPVKPAVSGPEAAPPPEPQAELGQTNSAPTQQQTQVNQPTEVEGEGEIDIQALTASILNLLNDDLTGDGMSNNDLLKRITDLQEFIIKLIEVLKEKTMLCASLDRQNLALTHQIKSLKDVVAITKDLLTIRNMEVEHLHADMKLLEENIKVERTRQGVASDMLGQAMRLNNELKTEYTTQLDLFQKLREKYNEKVVFLTKENKRLTALVGESPEGTSGTVETPEGKVSTPEGTAALPEGAIAVPVVTKPDEIPAQIKDVITEAKEATAEGVVAQPKETTETQDQPKEKVPTPEGKVAVPVEQAQPEDKLTTHEGKVATPEVTPSQPEGTATALSGTAVVQPQVTPETPTST